MFPVMGHSGPVGAGHMTDEYHAICTDQFIGERIVRQTVKLAHPRCQGGATVLPKVYPCVKILACA